MGQRKKAGVDWTAARVRWEAGESASSIAKDYGISRQAVAQRQRKEGWKRESITGLVNVSWLETIGNYEPVGYKDTPEKRATVLECYSKGMSRALAARFAGIAPQVIDTWRQKDETFDEQCLTAEKEYIDRRFDRLEDASERGDAKVDQWMLEHHEATKEDYAPKNQGSGGVNIIFKWSREQPIIEVNPDD